MKTNSRIGIPPVDGKRLKKLADLAKYGIHPVTIDPFTQFEVNQTAIKISAEESKQENVNADPSVIFDLITQGIQNYQHELNYFFYQRITHCDSLKRMPYSPLITDSLHNMKIIVNRMILLHNKECSLMVANPRHKSLKYLGINITSKALVKNKHVTCLLCRRGTMLFFLYGDCLLCEDPFKFKSPDEKIEFFWNYLNFANKKEFEYCPFHMNMKTNNDKINEKLKKYHGSENDVIKNYGLQLKNSNFHMYAYSIQCGVYFLHLIELVFNLGRKKFFMKAFQVGMVVVEILIQWMKKVSHCDIDCNYNYNSETREKMRVLTLFLPSTTHFLDDIILVVKKLIFRLSRDLNQSQSKLFVEFDNEREIFQPTFQALQTNVKITCYLGMIVCKDFFGKDYPSRYCTPNNYDGKMNPTTNIMSSDRYFSDLPFCCGLFDCPILLLEMVDYRNYKYASENDGRCVQVDMDYTKAPPHSGKTHLDCYTAYMFALASNNYIEAGKLFDQAFIDLEASVSETSEMKPRYSGGFRMISVIDIDLREEFLWYAMFLLKTKSKNACKYFDHLLQDRPLNGYLHFQYSIYLFQIIKNYKLSYYHLKLAKKLNSNMNVFSQRNEYEKYMILLAKKLNKQHTCNCNGCNKVLKVLNTCKGCRCVYYCSKRCQKKDWKMNHRNKCVSKKLEKLDENQNGILKRVKLLVNQLLQ